jgi:hypothetical protein
VGENRRKGGGGDAHVRDWAMMPMSYARAKEMLGFVSHITILFAKACARNALSIRELSSSSPVIIPE